MSEVAGLLRDDAVDLSAAASSQSEAIDLVGSLLVRTGAVQESYVAAMHERETTMSTYLAEGVAIPHGTNEAKDAVRRDALAYARFPDGVDWNGDLARVVIGIAAAGGGHVAVLAQLADILIDPERVGALHEADTIERVRELLSPE